jgi:hypothetical protein
MMVKEDRRRKEKRIGRPCALGVYSLVEDKEKYSHICTTM